jgi:hypothetical protein
MSNFRNKEIVGQLMKKPMKEHIYPSWKNSIMEPNYLHQVDILYLPTDPSGYKYLLTIIDVHNSLVGAYPLKFMSTTSIINGLNKIYDNSDYLDYPKILQGDNQFKNKFIKNWANDNDITMKFTLPDRHRQNGHVERFNQEMGEMLFKIMLDKEISTGKVSKEWVKYYGLIVNGHNNRVLEGLYRTTLKRTNINTNPEVKFNKNHILFRMEQ